MKCLICVSLFLVGNVNADARMIKKLDLETNKIGAYVYCIDGYKWLYCRNYRSTLTSTLNQMMEEKKTTLFLLNVWNKY